MSAKTERKPWEPRDLLVLLHNGKRVRVRAESPPRHEYGVLTIGQSRFYSVAAVLDPNNAEVL